VANKTGFLVIKTALQQGTEILENAAIGAPRLTAEVLLAHALGRERVYLYSHPEEELSELSWIHFGRYLHQRSRGVPTQYITKRQEFFGRDFFVCPDVLIPRPETELAVMMALERLRDRQSVIDVGCGSGAIAVTLALEKSLRVWASEISPETLRVAKRNASHLNAKVDFVVADVLAPYAPACFDMVVSNPPYVSLHEANGLQGEVLDHEPHIALFAGEQGTEIYSRLVEQATCVLRPGGWLVLELGWRSRDTVRSMLNSSWSEVEDHPDLAGIPRVLTARFTP